MTLAYFVKEVEKRGLQVAVAGIPKTIDNDIAVSSIIPDGFAIFSITMLLLPHYAMKF